MKHIALKGVNKDVWDFQILKMFINDSILFKTKCNVLYKGTLQADTTQNIILKSIYHLFI